MLRPFKSFLNNLQKNAETFFGSKNNSPDMNSNEEEEEIATESMYSIDELDPLADPLALDDELGDRTTELSSGFASRTSNLCELDSSDDGQIILVDVNSLKNSFTIPVSYAETTVEVSTTTTPSTTATRTSNGTREMQLSCEMNANNDVVIDGVSFDPIGLTLDDEVTEEVEGSRSDGSDSGLGLELCAGVLTDKTTAHTNSEIKPTKSNLKRKSDIIDRIDVIDAKKIKRNIQFTDVTVYYFPRIQGFTCVPSQGGCTLGMTSKHIDEKAFSLNEHLTEQKRLYRQRMLERSPRPSSSLSTNSNPLNAMLPNPALVATHQLLASTANTTTGDDRSRSSTEESDSEEELLSDNSSSELDTETGFLTPVTQKQRRALLKAAGVREIASSEKNECRDIRASREFCGCSCRDYCDPETCLCSRAGIKCQVDRASFPCGCTQDGCGNVYGRLEFNPKRVRTHFIHTIMRLELEKKQKKSDKQNTLHTYDGRLRLRESDEENSINDSSGINTRIMNFNSTNNTLYKTTTMQSTSGIAMDGQQIATTSTHYSSNEMDDPSRNCVSMNETPLDLHYAFRNDYSVDPLHNYSLIYSSNAGYYSNNTTTPFVDFNAMPTYSNYSTSVPYNGLMNSMHTPTTVTIPTTEIVSSCSSYLEDGANNDCIHNGTLFNHVDKNYLNVNQTKITTINSKDSKAIDESNGKNNEYVNDTTKLLDVTTMSAASINCLLNNENLTAHGRITVPSTNHNDNCAVNSIPNTMTTSSESHTYMRFESDFANKLNATQNYNPSNDSNAAQDDKSNESFQKDLALTT